MKYTPLIIIFIGLLVIGIFLFFYWPRSVALPPQDTGRSGRTILPPSPSTREPLQTETIHPLPEEDIAEELWEEQKRIGEEQRQNQNK